MFDFRFNTPIPSLNQGQRSIFKVRECAQSIPRIKLPLEGHLLKKILNIFYPGPVLDFPLKTDCLKVFEDEGTKQKSHSLRFFSIVA